MNFRTQPHPFRLVGEAGPTRAKPHQPARQQVTLTVMETDMPHQTNELDNATKRLLQELSDGLKHGFFEYVLICEVVHGRKRQLTIKAGKSHKFIISEDDLR